MLEIITGGALSTVQDAGRFGSMKNGFTQSGVMDLHAAKTANALLKNDPGAPVIEMTMKGLTAWFTSETFFCLSGGVFKAKLNDMPLNNNTVYKADKNDIISVGTAVSGMRCYLAVSGGFSVPAVMGSSSTNLKIGAGGYEGRKLRTYDIIDYPAPAGNPEGRSAEIPLYGSDTILIRAVPGPQSDMFDEKTLGRFYGEIYTVTSDLDRMGIRLEGPELKGISGNDIISDGIVFGSVQIPNSGKPIILMADHQTTGGYAKIATVASSDLPKLAQAKPGNKIRFSRITVEEAEELAIKEKKYIEDLLNS
jgi:biotin-dependent carboxylase-like uncharacterized protein